jgi:ribosomal-protein-alanine N-acetyltransferase
VGLQDALPVAHDRVLLRPLAERDAEAYASGSADDAVRRFAHLPLPEYTAETVRALVRTEVRAGLENDTTAVLAIADADDNAFLGSLVLFDITADTAEVDFWLTRDARGHGVATCALGAAGDVGRRLGLRTLTARAATDNTASHRTLAAAGLRPDGEPRETVTPSGLRAVTQQYRLELPTVALT